MIQLTEVEYNNLVRKADERNELVEFAMASHDLYKTGDPDAPNQIKNNNGEVVLDQCKKCGRAESELVIHCDVPPPTVELVPGSALSPVKDLPKLNGVARDKNHSKCMCLYFDDSFTDEQMRAVFDLIGSKAYSIAYFQNESKDGSK